MTKTTTHPAVGVFGTGSIGTRHLKLLAEAGVPVIAVPQRDARREELSRESWRCVRDLGELKQAGATAVIVATETTRHLDHVREAAELGFQVLAEKPLTASYAEAQLLKEKIGRLSERVHVACCMRFDEGLQKVKDLLPQIGKLYFSDVQARSYLPDWRPGRDYRRLYSSQRESGGVLLDLVHEIDYCLWFFGLPASVSGDLVNTGRLGIESTELASGKLHYGNGHLVQVNLDYLSRRSIRTARISGENGEIFYDVPGRVIELTIPGREKQAIRLSSAFTDMYRAQIAEWMSVLRGEPRRSLATFEEGVQALAICESWTQSHARKNSRIGVQS